MDVKLIIIALALGAAGGACGDALRPEPEESPRIPVPQLLVLARTDMTTFDPWRGAKGRGEGGHEVASRPRKGGVHSASEFVRFAIKQNLIQA